MCLEGWWAASPVAFPSPQSSTPHPGIADFSTESSSCRVAASRATPCCCQQSAVCLPACMHAVFIGMMSHFHVADELVDPAGEHVEHHLQQPFDVQGRLQARQQPLQSSMHGPLQINDKSACVRVTQACGALHVVVQMLAAPTVLSLYHYSSVVTLTSSISIQVIVQPGMGRAADLLEGLVGVRAGAGDEREGAAGHGLAQYAAGDAHVVQRQLRQLVACCVLQPHLAACG